MHYDNLSMDLYLRDGCGGVVKINCTQACPTMSPKEMVEYLASWFGQTVTWPEEVDVVDASPERVDDPPQEAGDLERAATEELDEEVLPRKAKEVVHLDQAPDEMYAGLTCSMGGGD